MDSHTRPESHALAVRTTEPPPGQVRKLVLASASRPGRARRARGCRWPVPWPVIQTLPVTGSFVYLRIYGPGKWLICAGPQLERAPPGPRLTACPGELFTTP